MFVPGVSWRAVCLQAAVAEDHALATMLEEAAEWVGLHVLAPTLADGRTYRYLPPVVDVRWTDAGAGLAAPHVLRQLAATIAAAEPRATTYLVASAHAEAIVDAMGEVLGRRVPQPGYIERGNGPAAAAGRPAPTTAQRPDGVGGVLHPRSVFLPLGRAHVESGAYVYGASMVAAAEEFELARDAGTVVPILFGDAVEDSGRLHMWALLDQVSVDEERKTRLGFFAASDLDGHFVPELVKVSDGKPVGRQVRRGYSVVETPSFLEPLAAALATPTVDDAVLEERVRRLRRLGAQVERLWPPGDAGQR